MNIFYDKNDQKEAARRSSFNVSIGTKITISLFLVGFLPLLFFGVTYIRSEEQQLEKEIFDKLALLAELKEAQMLEYFSDMTARTLDFSSDGYIRDETKKIIAGGTADSAEALSRHLLVNKKALDERISGISVLDTNGIVIAATDAQEIGGDESKDVYFKKGKESTVLVQTDVGDIHFGLRSPFVVAAQITDKDTHELVGVIVNVFDPKKMEAILSQNIIPRQDIKSIAMKDPETLHIYIVDRTRNVILHPIRKEIDPSHDTQLSTLPVIECMENKKEIVGTYRDHADDEVLGASACMPDNGLVLIVDVNKEAALLPIQDARIRFYGIMSAVVALIVGTAFLISRMLAKPIRALKKSTEIIRAGDLRHRVTVAETGDEIEELGNAFNAMAAALEERHRVTEEEKQKFVTLIEHLPVGVLMMTAPEGIVIAANPKSIELLGQEKDFLQDKQRSYADLYNITHATKEDGSPYPEDEFPINIALRAGRIAERADIVIKKASGDTVVLRLIGVPVKGLDGKVVYGIAVFDDVTKEREIDRAKTEFVSLASHQLRTPLSTINWYTEMLLAEDVGKITPDQKSYLEEIYKGNQRMVGLVNALLNVSRIEMGTFATEVKSIDCMGEADSALNELESVIQNKKLHITKEYAANVPPVSADQKMIHIIFENLLSNAVKYTPENGKIAVKIGREGDKEIIIEVSDTGYGIPKNQYGKIFTKLFRADNIVSKDTEGTGLGLYLVKLVVDHLGGRIWFVSEENKGTTFFITLPIHNDAKKHEQA